MNEMTGTSAMAALYNNSIIAVTQNMASAISLAVSYFYWINSYANECHLFAFELLRSHWKEFGRDRGEVYGKISRQK